MRYFILTVLLLAVSQLNYAQEYGREFKKVSQEELDLKYYEKDPEAKALVLFDVGESYFFDTSEGGYNIRFTRTKRIKIFDKSALHHAKISIPFYVDGYGKTEKITSIEAYTYNMKDGMPEKKKLDPTAVYEEQVNQYWRAKKFVFPDVQAGSVIEFKYVHETPFHFNLPDWTFQDVIPTLYSEYKAKMIPFYSYKFLAQGISKFDYQHSELDTRERTWGAYAESYGKSIGNGVKFKDYIYTYVLKDVPAFKNEGYITSPNDYIIKIDFQLANITHPSGYKQQIISTWEDMNKDLLKHESFGKYIKSCGRFVKRVLQEELVLEGKTQSQKIEAIINYVKQNFTWNEYYGKYASKSSKEFFTEKTGDVANINLFLIAMLRQAGIEANPVILSTRNHGKVKRSFPFSHFFNYVVVMVHGKSPFFADATEQRLSYGRIPPRCINEYGLLIKEKDVKWLSLTNNLVSKNSKKINLSIDTENIVANTVTTIQLTDYESYLYKKRFQNDKESIKKFLKQNGISKVKLVKAMNYDRPKRAYIIACGGEIDIEQLGGNLIIAPFLGFPMKENKLKQKERTYPVDFIYAQKEQYDVTLNIPDGFKVSYLPEPYSVDDELVNVQVGYKNLERAVIVKASYTFKKAIYQVEEYTQIKAHLDMIVKKFNEKIVLQAVEK